MKAYKEFKGTNSFCEYVLQPLLTNPSWEQKKCNSPATMYQLATKFLPKNKNDSYFLFINLERMTTLEDHASDDETERSRQAFGANDYNERGEYARHGDRFELWAAKKQMEDSDSKKE